MRADVGFVDRLKNLGSEWHVASYDFSHPAFDTDWRKSQILFGNDALQIQIGPHETGLNAFAGGSIRRENATHYGRYQVKMKAAKGAGLVTGFFTYSGPYYGTRHDEIDIEILGQDPSQLHIAWFVDGLLTNKFIDLGFDSSEKMAEFAFEWHPDKLRWFVKNRLVFEHSIDAGPIPTTPGRLFLNLWAADKSISTWAGRTSKTTKGAAEFKWVRFTPYDSQKDPDF